ncbi:MAG TPA: DUF4174 domain-containing protein [Acidobacteriaceae bacterium]|nr:DUF4174 domain-containing protein [Acidobacteriaceae bacterium]
MSSFKLSLVLFSLLGTSLSQAVAQSSTAQHPLPQLPNTRVLIVFAPAADSAAFRTQLQLLERHSYELSMRNTVVVPIASDPSAHFAFEHLTLTGAEDQAFARARFHVAPGEFAVILLNADGSEQTRSATPMDIHALVSRIDAVPHQASTLTASLY